MILFNSSQRQDFINIKDFKELNNAMLYIVQEFFFRLHQGPGINDLARTFGTFLVAKVEKRNLNPNKQMRLIEQPKQYSEPLSLSVDLNIKYPKYSLAEDCLASVLQALRRSSSTFTSVYVAVQKLKMALARASVQLGWQCQTERC
ncbi:hypothetical protein Tco_1149775 [Tanacetum coccineum]